VKETSNNQEGDQAGIFAAGINIDTGEPKQTRQRLATIFGINM
jgi:hypothetical protein